MKHLFLKYILLCLFVINLVSCGNVTIKRNLISKNSMITKSSKVDDKLFTTLSDSYIAKKKFNVKNSSIHMNSGQARIKNSNLKSNSFGTPFIISANDDGGYDAIIDGIKYNFTKNNLNLKKNAFVSIASPVQSTSLSDFDLRSSKKYKYAAIVMYNNSRIGVKSLGYAMYGEETINMSNINSSIRYKGEISGQTISSNNSLDKFDGDIILNVNFGINKIDGKIYNVKYNNLMIVDKKLIIENGIITGNKFKANLRGSKTAMNNFYNGAYGKIQGGFYGPNSSEIAAKFIITSLTHVGAGAFIAKKH